MGKAPVDELYRSERLAKLLVLVKRILPPTKPASPFTTRPSLSVTPSKPCRNHAIILAPQRAPHLFFTILLSPPNKIFFVFFRKLFFSVHKNRQFDVSINKNRRKKREIKYSTRRDETITNIIVDNIVPIICHKFYP